MNPEVAYVGQRVELCPDPAREQVGIVQEGDVAEVPGMEGVVPLRGTFWRAWAPTRLVYSLTLWRPWPLAIIAGGKRVENRPRPWRCLQDNLVALHTGQAWDEAGAYRINQLVPELADLDPDLQLLWDEPGRIVAVARVSGVTHVGEDPDLAVDPWASGPWCHRLEDVVALTAPVAYRGHQGVRKVPEDLAVELEWVWRCGLQACVHTWVEATHLQTRDREAVQVCRRCHVQRVVPWADLEDTDA